MEVKQVLGACHEVGLCSSPGMEGCDKPSDSRSLSSPLVLGSFPQGLHPPENWGQTQAV
jgi:hypothetical protein